MTFHDHFSEVAAAYAVHRPRYPGALFALLAQQCAVRERVWDAGCGSGQASVGLAQHFASVIATDPSDEQIRRAEPHDAVTYAVAAERYPALADSSVDLVTAAQAVHWFDRTVFYDEVARVLRPGGRLALWTYGLPAIAPKIDAVVSDWYHRVLGDFWPPERRLVEDGYRTIAFPFARVSLPPIAMLERWTRQQFVGYCGTWSAVKEYRRRRGGDALAVLKESLDTVWTDEDAPRDVEWPLTVLLGGPMT